MKTDSLDIWLFPQIWGGIRALLVGVHITAISAGRILGVVPELLRYRSASEGICEFPTIRGPNVEHKIGRHSL